MNRCATGRTYADDFGIVRIPPKMVIPSLGSGMEEWYDYTRIGIFCAGLRTFEFIALAARTPQIFPCGWPTGCQGNDVIEDEGDAH